jgi:predicted ATPase/DNA-binding CsgD family transcriptional regulator/tetratricopeptide (TPR) repeat protein
MVSLHHYLPPQPTSFVGREDEVLAITELLENQHCRLLTLVGPGGIGKTRLGIEVAERFVKPATETDPISFFPDGVYLVTLQSVASVTSIIPAIAVAIGFEFYEARDQAKQLINHIGDKLLLLILDNLEHLPDAGNPIDELLSGAPRLKLLATSREPINLRQEWLFHVEGMPFPHSENEATDTYDATRLFVERARRVRHDFSSVDDQDCVVRLCRLVDGMPLAIELAAAWLKSLSCMEVVAEIQHNLDILKTDMRGVPDRHRSMRAVFDQSWQLLDREERDLLMMLSVFRGGFRREAAEQIAGASLQNLSALVDKSMIALQSSGRYQLHGLQRQYGAELLRMSSDLETATRDRHCEYFTAFMDRPVRDFYGYGSKEKIKEIDADIDNMQTAWNWAVARGRFRDLHRCITGIYRYAWHRSWPIGVEQAFHRGLIALRVAEPGPDRDVTLGWALVHQSMVDLRMGRLQKAKEQAEESIAILEPLNARREMSDAFAARALVSRFERGRDPEEVIALHLEAAALLNETGEYGMEAYMYGNLGGLYYDIGQYHESERWNQKTLELSRRIDDPRNEILSLASLGRHALTFGEYGKARQYLLESLEIARAIEISGFANMALIRLGQVSMAVGDLETAERYFQECLVSARELGRPYNIANNLVNLAHALVSRKEYGEATALYQESTHYYEGSRVIQAESLMGLGQIACEQGSYAEAQRLHKESLGICEENGYRLLAVKNKDSLGRIAMTANLVFDAKSNFTAALKESVSIGTPPLILESLVSIGELIAYEGDRKGAAELVFLVMDHPASRAESKDRATRLLGQLESDVTVGNTESMDTRIVQDDLISVATKLLARLTVAGESAASAKTATSQSLLEPLSERELELLRLVAEGKSNREIALELTLALGTVKSHLHNIYQKLGAGSRTQAIIRARELDLL